MCNFVRLCLHFMPIKCKEYHPLGKALLLPDSSEFRLLLTLFGQSPKQSSLEAEGWHDFHICRRRNHEPREMYFTQLNVMARRWHFPCNRLCLLSARPQSKQVVILADFLFLLIDVLLCLQTTETGCCINGSIRQCLICGFDSDSQLML